MYARETGVSPEEFAAAGLTAKIVRYSEEPDQYYTTMDIPGVGVMELGVTHGVAWQKSALMGTRVMTGIERADALREAMLNATASTTTGVTPNRRSCMNEALSVRNAKW